MPEKTSVKEVAFVLISHITQHTHTRTILNWDKRYNDITQMLFVLKKKKQTKEKRNTPQAHHSQQNNKTK